jgi:hypothetical protein
MIVGRHLVKCHFTYRGGIQPHDCVTCTIGCCMSSASSCRSAQLHTTDPSSPSAMVDCVTPQRRSAVPYCNNWLQLCTISQQIPLQGICDEGYILAPSFHASLRDVSTCLHLAATFQLSLVHNTFLSTFQRATSMRYLPSAQGSSVPSTTHSVAAITLVLPDGIFDGGNTAPKQTQHSLA